VVGKLNLDGDGQGDVAGHGGEQRAVFVCRVESYERLRRDPVAIADIDAVVRQAIDAEVLVELCVDEVGGSALFEVARVTCVRRPGALGVPDRRLPQLRERSCL